MCGCWILRRWWRGSWGRGWGQWRWNFAGDSAHDRQAHKLCTFRRSLATHILEFGYDISTMLELLGHVDVSATMIHPLALNRGRRGVLSPADALEA